MSINPDGWFVEAYGGISSFGLKCSSKLYEAQSPFQKIEIYDTPAMGRILVLDGCFMVTEKDTFIYHEMLIHPAMSILNAPQAALVIGGGDGGAVTELVKYNSLREITLCEIDEMVTTSCRKFFPEVSSGLDDPRARCAFEDGAAFVANRPDQFDAIFVDSTDPIGPGKALYEVSFYQSIKNGLRKGGMAVFQTESPIFMADVFSETVEKLRSVFGPDNVKPYLAVIPSYPGAMWSFTMCLNDTQNISVDRFIIPDDVLGSLKYYNRAIHPAAFSLPQFVKKLAGIKN